MPCGSINSGDRLIDDGGAFLVAGHDTPEMSPPNPRRGKTAAFPFVLPSFPFHRYVIAPIMFHPSPVHFPSPKFVFCCAKVCVRVFLIPVRLLSGLPFPSPSLSEAFRISAIALWGPPLVAPHCKFYMHIVWRCFPLFLLV